MLTELTDEQIAKFPEYVKEWTNIGTATEPCSIEECRPVIDRVYEQAGLNPPKDIYLADSPISAVCKAKEILGNRFTYEELMKHQIFGFNDAYWLSFYAFLLKECCIEECRKLEPLMDLAKICGWWAPYSDFAIIQHRPCQIHLVDGVLHNLDGPAILFRDNVKVWAIEGVRVDEQIVMYPETQKLSQIQAEENMEVKRVRINQYGWENYLKEINAELLDKRSNHIDKTIEALFNCDNMRILVCSCISTGRVYCLEVSPEILTCEEAQKWLSPEGFCIGAS